MTVQETGAVLDLLNVAYPQFYSGPSAPDRKGALALWAGMFADDSFALVAAAVKAFIASDAKGFPPHIGAIKTMMGRLAEPVGLDAAQAWSLVRKAVSRSGYRSQEAFDALPESVQRLVGSPSQLHAWSQMDAQTLDSVVASNFQRAFRERTSKERQFALLPEDVKRTLKEASKQFALEEMKL